MADARIDDLLQNMQRMEERSDQVLQYVKQIDKRLQSMDATGQPSSSATREDSHTTTFNQPATQPDGTEMFEFSNGQVMLLCDVCVCVCVR